MFKQTVNSQLTTLSVNGLVQLDQGKQEMGRLYKFKLKKKKGLSQNLFHKVRKAKCLLGRQFWTEGTESYEAVSWRGHAYL